MKARGLNHERIRLGIMDGLIGLEKVFQDEFPNAKIQRCQVHIARNVLSKVPSKAKKKVSEQNERYFLFSKQIRVNKEFKRRTKPMEIGSSTRYLCNLNKIYFVIGFIINIKHRNINFVDELKEDSRRKCWL